MTTNPQSHKELIEEAVSRLKPPMNGDRLFGNVAATLVTPDGKHYSGVCIDTGSGTGFCAEASAIGTLVTDGHYKIAKIVAVWRHPDTDQLHVLPPCGRCREFIRQVDDENINTEVILGLDESQPLSELLPRHEWPEPLEDSN